MSFPIHARHDLRRLERALGLYPKEVMAAAVRAKNRSMTSARDQGARRVQQDLGGIKIGTIKRQLKRLRASAARPMAVLEFSEKRFRAFGNLTVRQIATKWGTGARIGRLPFRLELADGTPVSAEQMRRFFLQRTRSTGRVNVWVREGTRSHPFHSVVVPSLAHVFRERGLGDFVADVWRERFAVVFRQEAKFRLSKRT